MKVDDLMTSPVHLCSPEDNLRTAAQIMWDADCGCVAVVSEDRQLIGMITDRDICMAAHLTGERVGNISVAEVMSRDVCCCPADASIDEAVAIMRDHQVRRLPVTDDDGHVVGVLSLNDLAVASSNGSQGLSASVIGSTLAAISQHRPNPGSSEPH